MTYNFSGHTTNTREKVHLDTCTYMHIPIASVSSRALSIGRKLVNDFLCRGQGHLLANNFRMAAADLQRSVDLHSTMPVAWAAWGVALFKLGTTDGQVTTEIGLLLVSINSILLFHVR